MTDSLAATPDSLASRRGAALQRCHDQIDWYDKSARWDWLAYTVFQVATVVSGGLTPILLLMVLVFLLLVGACYAGGAAVRL